ncbi:hypothetical protein ACWDX6_09150 [Streptomyces sp. NPDC003027]
MSRPDDDHQWPSAGDVDHKWTSYRMWAKRVAPGLLVQEVSSGALGELLTARGFSVERIAEMPSAEAVLVILKSGEELNTAAEAIREKFQARVEII